MEATSVNEDDIIEGADRAPEIFVDGYRGILTNGQIVKVNFFQNRLVGEKTKKIAVFTLTTSITDFLAISKAFEAAVSKFQEDGVITIVASDEATK